MKLLKLAFVSVGLFGLAACETTGGAGTETKTVAGMAAQECFAAGGLIENNASGAPVCAMKDGNKVPII